MFTVQYVKNLKWENEEHSYFSCTVKYAEFAEEVPAGIDGIDPVAHIREIWKNANEGVYGLITEYVYVEPPMPEGWVQIQPTTQGAQTL